MAIDPTPARVNACAPRSSVSSAARAAVTFGDHNRTIAGFPLNAASERVHRGRSGSEKSGAGKGSYIQVVRGADAGAGAEDVVVPVDRGLKASVSMPRPFDDSNASVQRYVREHLRVARGPADGELQRRARSRPDRSPAPSSAATGIRSRTAGSSSCGRDRSRPSRGHRSRRGCSWFRAGARRSTPTSSRSRFGRREAAAPVERPSRRDPDRHRRRRRAPQTTGRPDRGRGRPSRRSRRSRHVRRCGGTRCAAGWRSSRESAAD